MLTPMTRRNRYMAGNICLVVFLALLISVASCTVQSAEAFTKGPDTVVKSEDQPVGSYYKYKIITTTESAYYSTINDIADKLQAKGSDTSVTKIVYSNAKSVNSQVYGYVYLVYANRSTDDEITLSNVYVYRWDNNQWQVLSGYATVKVPIPKYTSTGGGGGGAAAQPTQTTTTENATVTQTGNTATITPNVSAITGQLAAGTLQQLTFSLPSTVTATQTSLQMTAALVQALSSNPVPVQVQTANATVTLPQSLWVLDQIQSAVSNLNAWLDFVVSEVTTAMSSQVQNAVNSQPNAASYTQPLAVYQFELNLVQPGQVAQSVSDFGGGRATVEVPYKQDSVPRGLHEWKLNFYRIAGDTLTPIPTWIDSANNTAKMWLTRFSNYALMGFNKSFSDIVGHWAQGTVELLASKHIISGIDTNNFAPNRNITRAEFAALLQKMLGLSAKSGAAAFKDVKAGSWYYDAVQAAYQAGLVKGRGEGVFDPQANITRQEMAAMIVRTLNYLGVSTSLTQDQVASRLAQFSDQAAIAPWAREVAAVAASKGIISGRSGGAFAPTANATRAESATMLYNLMRSAELLK